MRHAKHRYRLGGPQSYRKALIRHLAVSLFKYERIITTIARAKACRPFVEKIITLAKKEFSQHRFRLVLSRLQNEHITHKIFKDIAPRFQDRNGGYTRILRLGGYRFSGEGAGKYAANRLGDNAKRVIFELVVRKERPKKEKKTEEKSK